MNLMMLFPSYRRLKYEKERDAHLLNNRIESLTKLMGQFLFNPIAQKALDFERPSYLLYSYNGEEMAFMSLVQRLKKQSEDRDFEEKVKAIIGASAAETRAKVAIMEEGILRRVEEKKAILEEKKARLDATGK